MEKKKISCSYALLVIIVFAALAFVTVYAYVQDKMETCSCPMCEFGNVDRGNNVTSTNLPLKDIAHNNMFGKIIVTKDGFVYFSVDEKYELKFSNDVFEIGTYSVDDYLLNPEETHFNGFRLNTSNIRSAYSFEVGNGGCVVSVVLITKDNKVEILNLGNYNGNVVEASFERVDYLSNIVSADTVVSFDGHGFVLYDINGNQYEI